MELSPSHRDTHFEKIPKERIATDQPTESVKIPQLGISFRDYANKIECFLLTIDIYQC